MQELSRFLSFLDPVVLNVLIGSVLIGVASAGVGTFTLLQKKSLIGDAVAHAMIPGIVIAFLLQGNKDPFWLMVGGFASGWLSLVFIEWVHKRSKLSQDAAIAIALSFFFAVGTVLLSITQRLDYPDKAGLNHVLFGSAVAMNEQDLLVFGLLCLGIFATIILLFKELRLYTFDVAYAKAAGLPVTFIRYLMTSLTVMAVVAGIQAVGVVLMAAMLITPAAAARFWSNKLVVVLILSCTLGVVSSITGSYISYVVPSPTGPWIVVVLSFIAILSFFFAPQKGIVAKKVRSIKFKSRILEENILKAFFQLGESKGQFYDALTVDDLMRRRAFTITRLNWGLVRLKKHGYLVEDGGKFKFTEAGFEKGKRVTRLHRLWEVYLTQYLNLADDHVHDSAETIEHIITPELEMKLEKLLDYPKVDPHDTNIPYRD